jgi:uncharacterized protein (DUF1684 family)
MKKIFFIIVVLSFITSKAQEKWTEQSVIDFQKNINKEYSDKKESPLTTEDFKVFKSLDFYPISSKYAVIAKFVKANNQAVFKMKTTGTRTPEYVKYGELIFTLDGKEFHLNLYQNIELSKQKGFEDYLFLPFSDLSCGKETYIGGRYIDMKFPKSDQVLIDFNKAYNPYCAYNHKYSCPIVPLDNDLNIEILAGVKSFHD